MLLRHSYAVILLVIAYVPFCGSFRLRVGHVPVRRWGKSLARSAVPSPKAELVDEKKLFFSQKTFQSLGLSPTLIQCVDTLGFTKPSKIQALSYYGINTGKPCIIADQTGSGKTLAYLLPTLQRMVDERKGEGGGVKRVSPYIVVMTPTAELAKLVHPLCLLSLLLCRSFTSLNGFNRVTLYFFVLRSQVSRVVKTLANGLKFRTACFTSLCDLDGEKKKIRLGADVVISTPGRLLQLLKDKEVDLSQLRVMVLDEADVLLLDESFPLQPIGQACKHYNTDEGHKHTGHYRNTGNGNSHSDAYTDKNARKVSTSENKKVPAPSPTLSKTLAPPTVSTKDTTGLPTLISPTAATQFLFVTATLPEVVVSQIGSEFPDVMTLKGPGLHRIASSVEVEKVFLLCVVGCLCVYDGNFLLEMLYWWWDDTF